MACVLKLQSRFARRFGQCLHAAVIQVTTPVEHHSFMAGCLSTLGDQLADGFCTGDIAAGLEAGRFLVRGGGHQRMPLAGVDDLRVNTGHAAEHSQTRPILRALDLAPDARVDTPANIVFRNLLDHLAFAPAPVLPAFFRSTSPVYRTPLFLYGSGLRKARMFAATWPTICLS